ncbi:ER lumen protein retaining receptor [Gregarina niphandrodes]|uniref:ER lumen protein retaining receptor n=1 Tax=Gregarina niphandrodes TaxID=110365 RepID=A0A023B491_GRENI|nr:ER lumen protein retaining receptor [Gregarina niphandrodes]EZG56400.1 ER lumen protein retaining receptor [Gregarina niphandrodes]|eukprot:XP_011131273.1 ER lumen protein retaining receptor [Gregarina niphandrodes]
MDTTIFLVGYMTQLVGSVVLLREIWHKRSIYGLSIDSLAAQFVATAARLVWSFDTRMKEILLAHVEVLSSAAVGLALLWSCRQFRHTASFQGVRVRWWLLVAVCAGAAVRFHPGPVDEWSLQMLIAFTFYLEGVALVPQLLLLRKVNDADGLARAYMVLTILSRAIRILFWGLLYVQGDLFPGLMFADVLQTLMSVRYLHVWWKYVRSGKGGLIKGHKLI